MSENIPQVGDKLTIKRGKLKGETFGVAAVDETSRTIAVKTSDGLVTTSFSNVNLPEEPTVTKSQLLKLLDTASAEYGDEVQNFLVKSLGWND